MKKPFEEDEENVVAESEVVSEKVVNPEEETAEVVEAETVEVIETEKAQLPALDSKPQVVAGSVKWNYEEIKAKAIEISDHFKGQVITDDNYMAVKATDKELGGYIRKLTDAKKDVDKILSKPKDDFDSEVKEVIEILKAGQEDIKAKYAPYDEERLAKKTEKIEEYKVKQIGTTGLRDEYACRVIVSGVTLSSKVKDDKANVDAQIATLVREQTANDQLTTAIITAVESGNITVTQKFGDEDKKRFLADAIEDVKASDKSVDELVSDTVAKINKAFDDRRAMEEKIAQEAVAKKKAELEEEARRAAELAQQEAIAMPAPEPAPDFFNACPDDPAAMQNIPALAPAMETAPQAPVTETMPQAPAMPQALTMPGEFQDTPAQTAAPTPAPVQQTAPVVDMNGMYHFQISIEGPFGAIRGAGDEILAVCNKYGLKFNAETGWYLDNAATTQQNIA